jgi:tRNA A-37 threonylcarbamoyl transferase component Bud32
VHRVIDQSALVARLRGAARHLPEVRRDRSLFLVWVKGARRAQIALALTFFVGLFVFPSARDATLEAVLPATHTGGGLFRRRRRQPHPAEDFARALLTGLYWAGGLGASATLLMLRLPEVAGRRREGADAMEGDGLVAGPPPDAALLGTEATMMPAGVMSRASLEATVHASAAAAAGGAMDLAATGMATLRPGGRYGIEAEIGRGGMGVVYRARDAVLDRVVALKELPSALQQSAELTERFRTEARVLARLTHPGIVQVFDLVEDAHGMWMALELVTGGSLDGVLDRRGALPVDELVTLGAAMADGLAYAHAQGVVHRDFKPHNVLLTPEGSPKITDFGLAKLAQGPQLTQVGAVLGSPAYMSPEQASGREADARSDMYSFGVTLYQMATGALPFEGDVTSVLIQHITQTPPRPLERTESLPEALDALIVRLLDKEAAQRFPDMAAVAEALRSMSS